jgi:ribosomal protein L37AE/L43A
MRDALARLLRWLLAQVAPRGPEPLPRCPYCGEERLVERDDRGWYCSVCGRGGRFADDPRRRSLQRVMGGR